ncbi:MAG: WD40 repeat domain-containing protein [Planctomycetota bacterium]
MLRWHALAINDVAVYKHKGWRAVTASDDHTLVVWDLQQGKRVGEPLRCHSDAVTCVEVLPDHRTALSGSADQTLCLWDLETGTPIHHSIGRDSPGYPINIKDLQGRLQVKNDLDLGHQGGITALRVFNKGRKAISAAADKKLLVWDLETVLPITRLIQNEEVVRCIAVSDDGSWGVTGSNTGTVTVWDLRAGLRLNSMALRNCSPIQSIALFDRGESILFTDREGYRYRWLPQRDLDSNFSEDKLVISALDLHEPSGTALAGAEDGTLQRIDYRTLHTTSQPMHGHTGRVNRVRLFDAGKRAVSVASDSTLRVWDLRQGTAVGKPLEGHTKPVNSVAIFDGGRKAVSASYDKTLRRWDLDTGQPIGKPLEGHKSLVWSVSVFDGGRKAVSASHDSTLRRWDLDTGQPIGNPLEEHEDWVNSVMVFDGGRKAVSASHDKTLRVWDLDTGQPIGKPLEGHTGAVYSVAVFDGGRKAVLASDDKTLRIWNLDTGQPVGKPLVGHTDSVYSVAVFDGGRKAVSASIDRTLRVWDLRDGRLLRTLTCDAIPTCIDTTGNLRIPIVGFADGSIRRVYP